MTALRQQFQAFVDANLSPPARSALLANAARAMRDGLISAGQASRAYDTYVDGREGAAEETVRGTGGGSIMYRFNYAAPAAAWALAFLRARAPARSGAFRDSFYVGVAGRFIPAAQFDPAFVPAGAEIVIGNTAPQSRKIDVQLDGRRVLHFSVPAGMFDDAVRAVRRQFGGAIKAKRVYSMNFPGQYSLHRKPGGPVQSPALILSPV